MIPASVEKYVYYREPGIVLLHGDCLEILPLLEPDSVDLVLTDPSYGIDINFYRKGNFGKAAKTIDYGDLNWNKKRSEPKAIELCLMVGKNQIIWGGNYFTDCLPVSRGWLVWEKGTTDRRADCEIAWTSFDIPIKYISHIWNGMIQENMANKEKREHPNQKPLPVISWCLGFDNEAEVILDPFLGSGTTAVAAKQLGRKCIGIEIESKYLDIAIERLRQEVLF